MRRGWFILLALSLGLNAGLLYAVLAERGRANEAPPAGFPMDPLFRGEALPPDDAAPPDAPPPPGGAPRICQAMLERRLQGLARRVDLDQRQRELLASIYRESLPPILESRDAIAVARRTLHLAYRRPAVDAPAIRRLVRDLTASQTRLDSLVVETMLREASVLSPEQRDRYFPTMPWDRHPGQGRTRGSR